MSIKDVPLSNIISNPLPVPVPPGLEKRLTSGNIPLSEDPQSGSILRVLMENGFKDKIESGLTKGHTYNILHAAPSTDFTLVESWTETIMGDDGIPVTNPKKSYQFFKITDDTRIAPSPEKKPESIPDAPKKPAQPDTEIIPTPAPEPSPKPEHVNVITDTAVSQESSVSNISLTTETVTPPDIKNEELVTKKAEEIVKKIKNGGAGMTPDDWQFRNENWPVLEKLLMSNTQKASNPTEPITQEKFIRPIEPVVATTPKPITSISQEPVVETTQHHEAKSWLMERLGQGRVPASVIAEPAKINTEPVAVSSYDLLKARFAKGVATTNASIESVPEKPLDKKQLLLESAFDGPLIGEALKTWDLAKTIPARPFIYPTEYSWGIEPNGEPVERSLENYPPSARKLREKVAGIIEELKTSGVDIETITLGDALEKANSLELL